MSDYGLQMAKALRSWEEENPWTSAALGFVPVVGQAYGLASAAAAGRDPDASALDKSLAAASIVPFGSLAKVGKVANELIGGPRTLSRLRSRAKTPEADKWIADRTYQADNPRLAQRLNENVGFDDMRVELPDPDIDHARLFDDLSQRPDRRVYLTDYMPDTKVNRFLKETYPEMWDPDMGPKIWRNKRDVAGGAYDDNLRHIQVNFDPYSRNRDVGAARTLSHELQHYIQNAIEEYKHGRRGSNQDLEGSYVGYLADAGEVEARLNSYRRGGRVKTPLTPRESLDNMENYVDWAAAQGKDGVAFRGNDELIHALRGSLDLTKPYEGPLY